MTTSDCRWCGDTGTVPGPDVPCPRCSPQSQGVPTVTARHESAALAITENIIAKGWRHADIPTGLVSDVCDALAYQIAQKEAAHERGRSQATCSGEWLSGSGGHRVFGGCNKPAMWVETDGGAAACDEHLGQHVRAIEKAKKGKR